MKEYKERPHWWYFLRYLFTLSLYPYDKSWDNFLTKMLDEGRVERKDEYKLKVNDATYFGRSIDVWVQNYAYAYGNPYLGDVSIHCRPSMKTIHRLYQTFGQIETEEIFKRDGIEDLREKDKDIC